MGRNRVMRLAVTDEGKLTRLPNAAALPCKSLYDASSGMLYVTGGRATMKDGSVRSNKVWMLDTKLHQPDWVEGPRLNTPRDGHCSFRLKDQLFVCGGYDGHDTLSSIETISIPNISQIAQWKQVREKYPIQVKSCVLCYKLTMYLF